MRRTKSKRRVRLQGLILFVVTPLLGLLLFVLVQDLSRSPQKQWTTKILVTAIDLYQGNISGRLQRLGVRCRFQPTCSHYARTSIIERGALVGTSKAVFRLLRCGPWTPRGTVDPP